MRSFYTTKMSDKGDMLKKRFEKILSKGSKFSKFGVFICFICMITTIIGSSVLIMGFNNENYNTYTITEHDADPKIKYDEKYTITFFKDNGEILYNQSLLDYRYSVNEIQDGLFKVYTWFGTNADYTVFVDTKYDKVSKGYSNLLCHDEKNVVYCENNKVFVADMFNDDKIHLSISRDFSETFTLNSAITYIELKGDMLCIRYLKGEEYKEVYEEIEF